MVAGPLYHPADAEGLFLGHLLGDYTVHLPENKYFGAIQTSKLSRFFAQVSKGMAYLEPW